ncbi:TPA: hydroxyacid dehydrogenase [Klebsiella aerogenes]|uniref:hydroxyacid dehydrogenase n=1 Tax=Klebsiella aerogenes TaxID=548 RepID=UPI0009236AB2|nr:hydroxyacid dehydrogenase [Klebsiella aerogenes]EKW5210459.1 hydroxyacid dehydrogenase [Klebsiella aerogenes]ELA2204640.1 hydroxyacid dehydrogenase [Klebsiella aerogenes]ELA2348243.1 hydroxyacid dehydrogenase [Klebsiella aerogenes]ELA2594386.1 hydroxyacid dehydrogenase [Klebsiella aerogenes]ELS4538659.1 hydroxyacid dehydrogenase [Klebsiella aerogenes]
MSAKKVVLVTGSDLAEAALGMLEDYELVFAGRQPTENQLTELCQQHNPVAILVRYGKITASVMDAAPALKVISKHGSGIDVIDVEAAAARGIMVRAATGANAAAVSEHAWALILACAKSIIPLDRRLREGHWDKSTHKSLELEGKTLGLIGLGAIGSRVAKIAGAFGMKVLAYDPYAATVPPGCERVDVLEDLLAQADVVSLHCPLTPQNRGMINAVTLAQCKPGAILVNTARGGLIDDAALAAALKGGALRWAALDSFNSEPLTTPHIWERVENVILSPHVGGVSDASYVKMGTAAAANILKVVQDSSQTETAY